jgi:hypothetical protein
VVSHSFAFRASRRLKFSYKSIENACTAFPHAGALPTTTRTSSTPRRRTVMSKYSSYTTIRPLRDLSPRANYTDRATAACQRSQCQLSRIEGAAWLA